MGSRGLLLYTDQALFDRHHTLLERFMCGDHCDLDLKQFRDYRLYTIRVNDADRLLFTTLEKNGVTHFVLLEEILNHDYQKARFLKPNVLRNFLHKNIEKFDAAINESDFVKIPALPNEIKPYTEAKLVRIYDNKFVVFNDAQNQALKTTFPMLVSGPAGSGKTTVAMNVLTQCAQAQIDSDLPILYVTESKHLKNDLQRIWDASPDKSDKVQIKTYAELFGNVNIVSKEQYYDWFATLKKQNKEYKDYQAEVIYQEFRLMSACADLDAYLALGAKQTQFLDIEMRTNIYKIFDSYKSFLKEQKLVDPAFEPLSHYQYWAIVVDEAQDLSLLQLQQLFLAAENRRICYCMDTHQSLRDNHSQRPFILRLLKNFTQKEPNHITLPYSYRCPEKVTAATAPLLAAKKQLTKKADKHEILEISSAPGAALGNVHWVEPSQMTPDQVRRFDEIKNSVECVIVTLPAHLEDAYRCFKTKLRIFTPEQVKGLEYKTVVAYRIFDDPMYAQVQAALKEKAVDKQLRKVFNRAITTFTRAQETLIIYQQRKKCHKIENIINQIPVTEWQAAEAIKPSTYQEKKAEQTRLVNAGNLEQAELLSLSIDEFIAHKPKYFVKAMYELLEDPNALEILIEERTINNKTIFEVIDNTKWQIFLEKIKEYIAEKGIKKLLKVPLTAAETIFTSFGESPKALEFAALLRQEVFITAIEVDDYAASEACLKAGVNPNTPNHNQLPICVGVADNDATLVSLLLKYKADINLLNDGNENALHVAAVKNFVALGELLLDNGAEINAIAGKDHSFRPAIMLAVAKGHKAFVEMLLRRGADSNIVADEQTPLYCAINTNNCELIELFTKHNACDLNKATPADGRFTGATPLHAAAQSGDLEAVRKLVEAGANIFAGDVEGHIPIIDAIIRDRLAVVQYFISLGIDINTLDSDGSNYLYIAIDEKSLVVAEYLIKNDIEVNPADDNFALFAVLKNLPTCLELLLSHGCDANKTTPYTLASLRTLAKEHNIERPMEEFIKARSCGDGSIAVNAKDMAQLLGDREAMRILGLVPAPAAAKEPSYIDKLLSQTDNLFEASALNLITHKKVVSILTEMKTQDGKSFFDAISPAKYKIFSQLFTTYSIETYRRIQEVPIDSVLDSDDPTCGLGGSTNAAMFISKVVDRAYTAALHTGNLKRVKSCLSKKARPLCSGSDKPTPLCIAADRKSIQLIQILLDFQYDPNEGTKDGFTPLHFCSMNGDVASAQLLIEKGANIEQCDIVHGGNPLFYAVRHKELMMLGLLLKHGANVNARTAGTTPFLQAIATNNQPFINILLDTKKCDLEIANANGETALALAIEYDNRNLVEDLLQRGCEFETPLKIDLNRLKKLPEFNMKPKKLTLFLQQQSAAPSAQTVTATPFELASLFGRLEIVDMLTKRKAQCRATQPR